MLYWDFSLILFPPPIHSQKGTPSLRPPYTHFHSRSFESGCSPATNNSWAVRKCWAAMLHRETSSCLQRTLLRARSDRERGDNLFKLKKFHLHWEKHSKPELGRKCEWERGKTENENCCIWMHQAFPLGDVDNWRWGSKVSLKKDVRTQAH